MNRSLTLARSSRTGLVAAVLVSAGLATSASADFIKLKDGSRVPPAPREGTITSADGSPTVTIEYPIKEGSRIKDTRTVNRTDVVEIYKPAADDIDAVAVKKLVPTADFLLSSQYAKLVEEGPAKFLSKYPKSKHAADVEAVKKTLEEEMLKTRQGMRKVEGTWITSKEAEANSYNINAYRLRSDMEKLAADQTTLRDALLKFDEIEKTGKFSVQYPKAIKLALETIDKLTVRLNEQAKAQPLKLKEKTDGLKNLNPDEKKAADEKIKKDMLAFKALQTEETRSKVRFPSTNDLDLPSLTGAVKVLEKERTKIAALDMAAIQANADTVEKILKTVGEDKFETARTLLDQFLTKNKDAGNDPFLKGKQAELKKAIESMSREARERRALEGVTPPPVPKPAAAPAPAPAAGK